MWVHFLLWLNHTPAYGAVAGYFQLQAIRTGISNDKFLIPVSRAPRVNASSGPSSFPLSPAIHKVSPMRSASLLRVISEAGLHPFSWKVRTCPHYGILYFISSEMLPILKCIPFSVVLTCKRKVHLSTNET